MKWRNKKTQKYKYHRDSLKIIVIPDRLWAQPPRLRSADDADDWKGWSRGRSLDHDDLTQLGK